MTDFYGKYPDADTAALTFGIANLASDTNLLAGRESTAVNNSSNMDEDHVVRGKVTTGTSPTAGRIIEIWAWAAFTIVSGTPAYPDTITGTDGARSITSANVKFGALALLDVLTIDSTSDRSYFLKPTSIADLFGRMPAYWGLWLAHNTAVNLKNNAGDQVFHYHRHRRQF